VIELSDSKTITKITLQKQNQKRYNIFLNEQYAFSVHEDVLIGRRLLKGKKIEDEEIVSILKEDEKTKIWQRSIKYLSYRPRTTKEVTDYLLQLEYEPELIYEVIEKLQNEKWLDDRRYAEEFTIQRVNLKPRGKMLIAQELKQKGISYDLIDASLELLDSDKEYQMAFQLASKKFKQYKNNDWIKVQTKVGGFLQRKGFSYDLVARVLRQLKESGSIE